MPRLPQGDFFDWAATLPVDDSTAQSASARPALATLAAGSLAPPGVVGGADGAGDGAVADEARLWHTNAGGQEGLDIEAFIDACRHMHGDRARWTSYSCVLLIES